MTPYEIWHLNSLRNVPLPQSGWILNSDSSNIGNHFINLTESDKLTFLGLETGRLFYPSSCDFCRDGDPTSGIQLIFILPRKKREKSQSQSLFYEAWLTCWSITSVRPHYSSFLHFTHNITENWTCSVTQGLTHSREIALSWKRRLYSLNYRLWLTLEMLMLGNVRRKKDQTQFTMQFWGLWNLRVQRNQRPKLNSSLYTWNLVSS